MTKTADGRPTPEPDRDRQGYIPDGHRRSSRKEGRVEVRPADSMTWGTVCHNQFDIKDADVVCKMLGYPSAQLVRNDAYFGPGRGPIYMDNLRCNGDENSLFNCSYPGWMINDLNCSHDRAAGVECTGLSMSVDYDPKTDFMYWPGLSGQRARRDGSGQETIVRANVWCLRLDHAGGNVYWIDFDGHISVARKDGSFVRTLLTLQGSTKRLVLDPRNGTPGPRPNLIVTAASSVKYQPCRVVTTSVHCYGARCIYLLVTLDRRSEHDGVTGTIPFLLDGNPGHCHHQSQEVPNDTLDVQPALVLSVDRRGVHVHVVPTLCASANNSSFRILMYWVDHRGSIHRAAMDGSNQTTIIRNLTDPRAITIDYTGEIGIQGDPESS
ncbi:scavenger receptor [Branchiostoma belcheri]|nr:scavenger receptor [Branchiostoma belcheri]